MDVHLPYTHLPARNSTYPQNRPQTGQKQPNQSCLEARKQKHLTLDKNKVRSFSPTPSQAS
ncbi:MAG: hypothetical protein P8Y18_06965 [Candidatus Bathyarchaeota archaeon]